MKKEETERKLASIIPRMIFLLFLFITFFTGTVNGNHIVKTTHGFIRGKSVGHRGLTAFLGIPYAEPPVGPLRFRRTVAKAPWKGVYNATNLPPTCIQFRSPPVFYSPDPTVPQSEDCLYLNVWAPPIRDESRLKPIFIFIHGGYFLNGATNMPVYNGANLAEYGDIIMATMNYRVSALGYLYGYIDEAGGNMGMYDQVTAIRWIKDNARAFGGDPDNIVLAGHSAGSISASAHVVSPLSKNLFKRVILQSAAAVDTQYNDNNRRLLQISETYANFTGCTTRTRTLQSDPKSVIECMRRLPAERFSEIDLLTYPLGIIDPFILRTGDEFLPESPIDSYRKGNFNKIEVLTGLTRNEGSLVISALRPLIFGPYGELANNITINEVTAREILNGSIKTGFEFIDDKFIQTYLSRVGREEGYTYLRAVADAQGDYVLDCGVIFQSDLLSRRNIPVYFYMFDYRPDSTPLAEWMNVTHFDDLQYYYGNPLHANFTEFEKVLSRYLMDTFVAFIKTGNPNTPRGPMWPQYSYKDPKFLTVGRKQDVSWSTDLNRCEFWRSLYGAVFDDHVKQNFKNSEIREKDIRFPKIPEIPEIVDLDVFSKNLFP